MSITPQIDAEIEQLKALIEASKSEIETMQAKIRALELQKSNELEKQSGLKVGEYRALSDDLRANLATRDWWTALRHGGYDPFKVHSLGDTSVYIEDRMGGATGAPYDLVCACEKVTHD